MKKSILATAVATLLVSSPGWADRTWNYTYNELGLIESTDGPRTDATDMTNYGYDAAGYLTSVTNALGQITTLSDYNGNGLPQKITDANGTETLLEYNWRGQVIKRTTQSTAGNAVTSFTYDPVGQLTRITLPDNRYLDYTYDGARRLTGVSNGAGEKIVYELDAMGNRTKTEIKDGADNLYKLQTQVFDELGRMIKSIGAAGQETRYGYDTNSNLTSITDPRLNTTTQAFDALNRLIKITDADLKDTQYTYDSQSRINSVTNPRGLTTTYEYNYAGDKVKEISPDTGTTTFTHDDAGNVLTRTDARGVVTEYSYDALNRLTEVRYPANPGENIHYSYDDTSNGNKGIGRLTGIADQSGSIVYRYDDRGNLTQETRVVESQPYSTHYFYDLANKLTRVIYPSGRIVHYDYNTLGQVNQIRTQENDTAPIQVVIQDVSYLPFGPLQSLTYGNGEIRTVTYDQDYQLTHIQSTVLDRQYGYDTAGNIDAVTDLLDSSKNQTFQYDALARLTQANGAYGALNYDYDAVGNRTSRTQQNNGQTISETYTYASDSNRLLQVNKDDNGTSSTRTLSYSDAGNITLDKDTQRELALTYNQQNRLQEVSKDGQPLATYVHNALGQRVIKVATDPTANQHFHYDQNGLLIAESTPMGSITRETIYLNGVPVAVVVAESLNTAPSEIIIDNTSSGVTVSGTWSTSTWSADRIGENYHYVAAGNQPARFTWDTPVAQGLYRVYAYWNSANSRTSRAAYTVTTTTGPQTVEVSQQTGGGQWNLLGTFTLGTNAEVYLTDETDGYVIADAIKLESAE
ncbi:hypothetical protein [Hahella sp. CCB-MM4]|uniref:golvesin C-terminal-like domain-containing protein n=1 Tax=Hahella sp. (strain CCB-MM4) TaxID=1926491 RepID=UPI001AEF4D8E|nr:hypothetical protein [Hahella sp. CCB-MM4]